jgi:hypothetical protein
VHGHDTECARLQGHPLRLRSYAYSGKLFLTTRNKGNADRAPYSLYREPRSVNFNLHKVGFFFLICVIRVKDV